jgi:Phage integrase family
MIDIRSAFDTAKKKAEIPEGFRFHDLRHTTASWLKMGGADDYTVMEILGHSGIMMMKRYAHLDQAHKRKALAMLPGWTWHKSGANAESEEKEAAGQIPQPLVLTGAEGGI